MAGKNKAVFFDRDGTLNVDVDYLHRIEDFRWIEGAVEAIRYAHEQGYLVVVVTNQSGVARGFFGEEDVIRLHKWMDEDLARRGVGKIDAFYYCPHHPQAAVKRYAVVCDCRKPKSGMFVRACRELDIEPSQSLMLGDSERDVVSAESVGIRGVLYGGGSLLDCLKASLGQR